jgi:uncharacterized protein involved in exopolysaccharide biosynthesis
MREQENIPVNSQSFDDEISLIDLLRILCEQWQWILGLALVSPLVALAICATLPKQYEATVLLQIGKLSSSGSGSSADIEPQQNLIERVHSGGFDSRLEGATGSSLSVKATAVKNTKLVRLTTNATSVERASKGLENTLALLQEDHKKLADESEKTLGVALQNARDQLKTTSDSITQLNRLVIALSPEKSDPISALLLTQTQQQLFQQQSELKEKVAMIESGIAEQRLYKTTSIEPFQVSTSPVYPKTRLAALLAFLGGGIAGVIVAFLRNALSKRPRKVDVSNATGSL